MLVMMVALALALARRGPGREGAGRWLEAARTATLASHAAAAGIDQPRADRRTATVDDEHHHAAYNAYLAALAEDTAPRRLGTPQQHATGAKRPESAGGPTGG
jgi:hypothetical protein